MDKPSELVKIRRVLQLARAEINQQDPDLALESLRTIKNEVEENKGTPEWAEFFLLFAEAHCAKCDALAETYLIEAEEKLHSLPDSFPDLEFRLSEHFGDHYARVGKFSKARERYGTADSLARNLGVREFVARIELKARRIDLHIDGDQEEENLKTLRRVGKAGNFTCEHQLATWYLHLGQSSVAAKSILVARHFSKASESYFNDLLNSARRG